MLSIAPCLWPAHDFAMSPGEKLREAREKLDLSREELSRRTGISAQTIYRAEKSRSNSRSDTFRELARALGISVGDLYDDDEVVAEVAEVPAEVVHLDDDPLDDPVLLEFLETEAGQR